MKIFFNCLRYFSSPTAQAENIAIALAITLVRTRKANPVLICDTICRGLLYNCKCGAVANEMFMRFTTGISGWIVIGVSSQELHVLLLVQDRKP